MGHRPKYKAKTINFQKENVGENLCPLGFGKYFLQNAHVIKEKNVKLDFNKIINNPFQKTLSRK